MPSILLGSPVARIPPSQFEARRVPAYREQRNPGRGQEGVVEDPARFDGVTVIGVDEPFWRDTRCGDKYVIVIIDLISARDKTGPGALTEHGRGSLKSRTSNPASPGVRSLGRIGSRP